MESKSASAAGNHVFISYSHADSRWLEQLLRHLRPLMREGFIQVFSDRNIRTGADWQGEIQCALEVASIAVLLISADFLASDFIINQELPRLLAGAASRGMAIMPVIVGPSLFEMVPSLSQFQAANPPSRPLSAMRASEWKKVLVELAREIHRVASRSA
jgi:TIR domain-containing protein